MRITEGGLDLFDAHEPQVGPGSFGAAIQGNSLRCGPDFVIGTLLSRMGRVMIIFRVAGHRCRI
jgi:hypothetical protein